MQIAGFGEYSSEVYSLRVVGVHRCAGAALPEIRCCHFAIFDSDCYDLRFAECTLPIPRSVFMRRANRRYSQSYRGIRTPTPYRPPLLRCPTVLPHGDLLLNCTTVLP
jgi:hypothetical protein